MNVTEVLANFGSYDFGEVDVSEIHLSILHPDERSKKKGDDYYPCAAKLALHK